MELGVMWLCIGRLRVYYARATFLYITLVLQISPGICKTKRESMACTASDGSILSIISIATESYNHCFIHQFGS